MKQPTIELSVNALLSMVPKDGLPLLQDYARKKRTPDQVMLQTEAKKHIDEIPMSVREFLASIDGPHWLPNNGRDWVPSFTARNDGRE